jgi:hypothetical protein
VRFSLNAARYDVNEGGSVQVRVRRRNGLGETVSVRYSTSDGSAQAGSDYVASEGTLTFGPGVLEQTVTVVTIDDTVFEEEETFTFALFLLNPADISVQLENPSSATIAIALSDPVDRPDGLAAPRSSMAFVGDNVYNSTGDGQIATRHGNGNSTIAFVVRVQNDGNAPDAFRVTGVASGTAQNASVRYFRHGADITAQVTGSGGFAIPTLAPQATADIDVEVRFAGSARYSGYGATVTIASQRTPARTDVVRVLGIVNQAGQATPASLGNLSTRLAVQTGDRVMIGGFIITGEQSKKVVIRGIGPSLAASGLTGLLADPTLEIRDSTGRLVAVNDNWDESPDKNAISASGAAPTHAKEPAILMTLTPGAYTSILRGKNDTVGIALVELFDLDLGGSSRLGNISTRGFVETQDNVMIGGFIVTAGNDSDQARVIVRAVGPSLEARGVPQPLQDTILELRDRNGALVASNNHWRETQEAEIQASGLQPTDDREAAILTTVPAGAYTAIVRGAGGTTGIALVEVFMMP